MTEPDTSTTPHLGLGVPRVPTISAARADMHEAFDVAADQYVDAFGTSGLEAFSPDLSHPDRAPLPYVAAQRAAAAEGGAWPYAAPSSFNRRVVKVVSSQTHTEVVPGPVCAQTGVDLIVEADGDAAPLPDEIVQEVTCTSYRARYKPVVTRNPPPSTALYAALRADVVLAYFPTSAQARAFAVALCKDPAAQGTFDVDVVKVTRREAGPLLSVSRTRVAATTKLKGVYATAKPSVKITGWVFGPVV